MRMSMKDLEAFARTEAEIKAIDTTAPAEVMPSIMEENAEWIKAQQEHEAECVDGPRWVFSTCRGDEVMCQFHGRSLAARMAMEGILFMASMGRAPVSMCPFGCGEPQLRCWSPKIVPEQ